MQLNKYNEIIIELPALDQNDKNIITNKRGYYYGQVLN